MFWASSNVYPLCFMQSLDGAVVFLADLVASTWVRIPKATPLKTTIRPPTRINFKHIARVLGSCRLLELELYTNIAIESKKQCDKPQRRLRCFLRTLRSVL